MSHRVVAPAIVPNHPVIPAKAGIQRRTWPVDRGPSSTLDPRLREDDSKKRGRTTVAAVVALSLLALAACGKKDELRRRDGGLPPAPYGATASPTAAQMLDPPAQAAPERVDDPIKRSEERREDRFELPPQA